MRGGSQAIEVRSTAARRHPRSECLSSAGAAYRRRPSRGGGRRDCDRDEAMT